MKVGNWSEEHEQVDWEGRRARLEKRVNAQVHTVAELYAIEAIDALADAQATIQRQERLRLEEMAKRERAEGTLASCTDLMNSWAREWGVAESPDEWGVRALAERLWDRMAPEILNLREDKRIALADVELLQAELARLRADAKRLDWQPIVTAPKDGTTVLLWGPYPAIQYADNPRCQMGRWDSQSFHSKPRPFWQWGWMGIDWARANPPTHWMPLPDPPTQRGDSHAA